MRLVLNERTSIASWHRRWGLAASGRVFLGSPGGTATRFGCSRMRARTSSGGPGGAPMVAGPDTRAWVSPTRPGELIMGARLLPGAGGAALGVPLGRAARHARAARRARSRSHRHRVHAGSGDAPAGRGRATGSGDPGPRPLCWSGPGSGLIRLRRRSGFSERQLRRRFPQRGRVRAEDASAGSAVAAVSGFGLRFHRTGWRVRRSRRGTRIRRTYRGNAGR